MEKKDLKFETLKYSGKILKKSGNKDGKDWKLWQLSFETGKQYPWKVSAFDGSLSQNGIQVAAMVEGQFYEVGYVTESYPHPQHGTVNTKRAIIIKDSVPSKSTLGQSQKEETPKPKPQIDLNSFGVEYHKLMDKNPLKCELHMLGSYILNFKSDEFLEVIDYIKSTFKK